MPAAMPSSKDRYTQSYSSEFEARDKAIAELKEELTDTIAPLDGRLEEVEASLATIHEQMDDLPTRNELRGMGKSVDQFHTDLSALQRKIDFNNANIDARMRNRLASRFPDTVRPVQVSYTDRNNRTIYKDMSAHKLFRRKNAGYYWRIVEPKNHPTLIAVHKILHIDYQDWAYGSESADRDEYDTTESEDETPSLSGDSTPESLEDAVRLYPTEAVRAIFNLFGLAYHTFREKLERDEARRAIQVSATRRVASEADHPQHVRRQKTSDYRGSTTEMATRSTKSVDSQENSLEI